ncbi:MAG: hypothetical protein FWG06_03995 [Clostridiales bacterium]|nr:hypothetical protein [Clostridiales bacterium]
MKSLKPFLLFPPVFLRGRLLTQLLLAYSGGLLLAAYLSPAPRLWGWVAGLLLLSCTAAFGVKKRGALLGGGRGARVRQKNGRTPEGRRRHIRTIPSEIRGGRHAG